MPGTQGAEVVAGTVLAQADIGGVDRGGLDGDAHLARPALRASRSATPSI